MFERHISFIVDTGATCSIIDQQYLPQNININNDNKITIRGINGTSKSLGYIKTFIQYNNVKFSITLHVVPSLPSNIKGLLGTDFFTKIQSKN